MYKLTTEEIKKLQLDMLVSFAEFCDSHDITYYLSSGTLLGAVRHKGFIPWDDDIDIMLPRQDYDRAVKEYWHPVYKIDDYLVNPDAIGKCGRIYNPNTILSSNLKSKYSLNVFIDLFPIDGVEELKLLRYEKMLILKLLINCHSASITAYKRSRHYDDKASGFLSIKTISRTAIKFIMIFFFGHTKPQFWIKLINKVVRQVPFGSTELVGCISNGYYGSKEIMSRHIYDEKIAVDFEGYKFWAPSGYSAYLTNLYGDYMTPPPENKRVSHHQFEAFRINGEERNNI